MLEIDETTILATLSSVKLPDSNLDIVSQGMVSGLTIRKPNGNGKRARRGEAHVAFALEIDASDARKLEPVRRAAEQAVYDLGSVASVSAVMTAHQRIPALARATTPKLTTTVTPEPASQPAAAPVAKTSEEVAEQPKPKRRGRPKKAKPQPDEPFVSLAEPAPTPAPKPAPPPPSPAPTPEVPPAKPIDVPPQPADVPPPQPEMIEDAPLFTALRKPKERVKINLPNVRHIVAVASGKGGVGKSTTAVNLAVAFMQNGLRVGLLDADIYGPSIPTMLRLSGHPRLNSEKKMLPHHWNGMAVMSIGFLVEDNAPMIWRGPMVHGAVTQLFRDVDWGRLDILVVDLPPGTGDAQLTLAQNVELSGAIIVSTPQDIALIDARKGLQMFERVNVPVLGIVENMSYFECPHCHELSAIFSNGGAREEAEKLHVPFLGEIPLDISLRQHADEGRPLAFAERNGALADTYRQMAKMVWKDLHKDLLGQEYQPLLPDA